MLRINRRELLAGIGTSSLLFSTGSPLSASHDLGAARGGSSEQPGTIAALTDRVRPNGTDFPFCLAQPRVFSIGWTQEQWDGTNLTDFADDVPEPQNEQVLQRLFVPLLGGSFSLFDHSRVAIPSTESSHPAPAPAEAVAISDNGVPRCSISFPGQATYDLARSHGTVCATFVSLVRVVISPLIGPRDIPRNNLLKQITLDSREACYRLECVSFPNWETTIRVLHGRQ